MSSDWWAKKLGRPANSPGPSIPPAYGPTTPPMTAATPAGIQFQMQQEQQENGRPSVMIDDPDVPGGRRMNWRAWAGGQANREETGRCPNCGSTNFFSRRQNSMVTQRGVATPAPQCFECSYNGAFQIFGGG